MKKFLHVFLALAAAMSFPVSAAAQEAIGSRAAIVSPAFSSNGSITFNLYAPKASEVTLIFNSGNPIAMTKGDDGVWTSGEVYCHPELFTYFFDVDGTKVLDPNNVFTIRDVATVSNLVIVPAVQTDVLLTQEIPHGDVTKKWYHSKAFNADRRLTVYTPPGYDPRGTRRYPVLYLLHGMGGDENAWTEQGRADRILDMMNYLYMTPPFIVVMPNGNVSMQAAPGENPGELTQPVFNLPRTMNGEFERAFPEIVEWTDSVYLTVPDKAHRAIAGLSMGGLNSVTVSMNNPEMFDYVGLFSPATPVRAQERAVNIAEEYARLPEKLSAQAAQSPRLYWLGIGSDDFLYKENVELRRQLDAAGMKYIYHESDGGHTWKNWRAYLPLFLRECARNWDFTR